MSGKTAMLGALLAFGISPAGARAPHGGLSPLSRLQVALGTVGTLLATPGTISFSAANPGSGVVSGSSISTVSWLILGGSHAQNWTLSLQASSNAFAGCPTLPVSAVQVSCSTASVSGGGGSGACSGSFPLSTTLQQIAGGAEGDGNNSHSVLLAFTLAESWHYVANPSCTITVTYSVNAQ